LKGLLRLNKTVDMQKLSQTIMMGKIPSYWSFVKTISMSFT